MATRLTGFEAIELAERINASLSKHAEPGAPARDDLTPAEARVIAARNPDLVYIDFNEPEPGPTELA
jgi:hypothetical protein